MFCGNCGTKNEDGAKFCKACGTNLASYFVAPAPTQTAVEAAPTVEATPAAEVAPAQVVTPSAPEVEAQAAPEAVVEAAPVAEAMPAPATEEVAAAPVEASAPVQQSAPQPDVAPQQMYAAQPNQAPQQGYIPQPGLAQQQAYIPQPGQAPQQAYAAQAAPAKKKGGAGKVIAILAVLILAAAIAGGVYAYMKMQSTINLNDYVEVTFNGYDGYGSASVRVDWSAVEDDYGDEISYTSKAKKEYGVLLNLATPTDVLRDYVSVSAEGDNGSFSNGDEVSCTWEIDEDEMADYLDCNIKYSDFTITVDGLKEVETFDPFENLTVTFDGTAPLGTVDWSYSGDIFSGYDFSCVYEGLSNGDVVTITLIRNNPEYYAQNYGKIPSVTQKEYTVEGLASYLTDLAEISDAGFAELQNHAESAIAEYTNQWSENVTLEEVEYIGEYLAVDGLSNEIGLVYALTASIQESEKYSPISTTCYYYVGFYSVVVSEDGMPTLDDWMRETPWEDYYVNVRYGSRSYETKTYWFVGYESWSDLVRNRTETFGNDYTLTWNLEDEEAMILALENEENGDYLCSYSSEREMTADEIEEYMAQDYSSYYFPGDRTIVQMLINEIYARNGYIFSDEELLDYFGQKEWYASISDKTSDMNEIYKNMSDIEQQNVTLLQEYK